MRLIIGGGLILSGIVSLAVKDNIPVFQYTNHNQDHQYFLQNFSRGFMYSCLNILLYVPPTFCIIAGMRIIDDYYYYLPSTNT